MKKPTKLVRAFAKAMALKLALPFPVEIAGSIRRESDEVGDIDLVVTVPELEQPECWAINILAYLSVEATSGGRRRATGNFDSSTINLWTCLPEESGAMLFYATGPKNYNIAYRQIAKRRGWKLNEKGLWNQAGDRIAGAEECDIYAALGKDWVEPKLRGRRRAAKTRTEETANG